MLTVSAFADEIAEDLETQLAVLSDLGIRHIDLRSVEGTNVLDLTDREAASIRDRLDERGVSVAAIGSPIGKIGIEEDFGPHFDRFERAIELADFFEADAIRLFSYWIPSERVPADYRELVLRRMEQKANRASDAGVVLLHENEKDTYGDTPQRCRDIVRSVDADALGLVFDPANFLEIGVPAFPDAFEYLAEDVSALHVKDAVRGERGTITPAGEGDARFEDLLAALEAGGFDGYASIEPHLTDAFETGGYSGADAFRLATRTFIDILEQEEIPYR